MIYLNLQTQLFRSPEYIGSEPTARATWLNVLAYCCEQENGGRIAGARAWKDRQWQQTCGVTLAEVMASAPLLTWDGDDLLCWAYPSDKEEEVKANRERGRRGGSVRSEAKARAARINGGGQAEPKQNPSSDPTEGKGIGMEGKEEVPALVLLDVPSDPKPDPKPAFEKFWQAYPRKEGKKAAFAAFQRCEGAEKIQTILTAISAQRRGDSWARGFIPHPTTWLNQGRWEDEVFAAPTKQAQQIKCTL